MPHRDRTSGGQQRGFPIRGRSQPFGVSPASGVVMWSHLRSDLAPAATGARSLHILEKSRFGHADRVAAGDDDVIQDSDVH